VSFERRLAAATLAVCATLAARVAHASPALDLIGAVGGNGGVQAEVSGPSAASTYFNPAFLTEAEDDFTVGYVVYSEQMSVFLDGRNGGDVPLSVAGRNMVYPGPNGSLIPIPNDSVPTQWLEHGCPAGTATGQCAGGFAARPRQNQPASGVTRSYLAVGLVKHLFDERLALGFYALLPLGSFIAAREYFPDEREALFTDSLYPELYGDRMQALSLVFGAGVKITRTFSLGAGVSLGVANTAQSSDYVRDPSNYNLLLINNNIATSVTASPTLGARWQPVRWFQLGFAAHAPEKFAIDTDVSAALPNGATSTTTRDVDFDYDPWRLSFGAQVDVVEHKDQALAVVASANYGFWSTYKDRQGQSPSVYSEHGVDLAWSNTLGGALGVRFRQDNFRDFVDFVYQPSPVPEQIGRSNYVDNDRVGVRLGGNLKLALGPVKFTAGLQLFGDRLVARHNQKNNSLIVDELPDDAETASTPHEPIPGETGLQTNNPGWPGFGSEGWLYGGGVTLAFPL
jgi:long-chain fatty acid transport protein